MRPSKIFQVTSGSSNSACGCGSTAPLTANHVVAGARGMMRYRRTRAATVEASISLGGTANGGDTGSRGSGGLSGGVSTTKPTVSALVGRVPSYSSTTTNSSAGGKSATGCKQVSDKHHGRMNCAHGHTLTLPFIGDILQWVSS